MLVSGSVEMIFPISVGTVHQAVSNLRFEYRCSENIIGQVHSVKNKVQKEPEGHPCSQCYNGRATKIDSHL